MSRRQDNPEELLEAARERNEKAIRRLQSRIDELSDALERTRDLEAGGNRKADGPEKDSEPSADSKTRCGQDLPCATP